MNGAIDAEMAAILEVCGDMNFEEFSAYVDQQKALLARTEIELEAVDAQRRRARPLQAVADVQSEPDAMFSGSLFLVAHRRPSGTIARRYFHRESAALEHGERLASGGRVVVVARTPTAWSTLTIAG